MKGKAHDVLVVLGYLSWKALQPETRAICCRRRSGAYVDLRSTVLWGWNNFF